MGKAKIIIEKKNRVSVHYFHKYLNGKLTIYKYILVNLSIKFNFGILEY